MTTLVAAATHLPRLRTLVRFILHLRHFHTLTVSAVRCTLLAAPATPGCHSTPWYHGSPLLRCALAVICRRPVAVAHATVPRPSAERFHRNDTLVNDRRYAVHARRPPYHPFGWDFEHRGPLRCTLRAERVWCAALRSGAIYTANRVYRISIFWLRCARAFRSVEDPRVFCWPRLNTSCVFAPAV